MDTKTKLEASLKDAIRANDDLRKRSIRMVIAAIRFAEVENSQPTDDAAQLAILQKEIKSRRESIQEAEKAGRPDLVKASQDEIGVLEEYLPKQLTPDELQNLVQQAVIDADAKSPADMGKVMKILIPRVQGRAPGDQVSRVVRQILQNS
jgi:uncharacterized protein YqeY